MVSLRQHVYGLLQSRLREGQGTRAGSGIRRIEFFRVCQMSSVAMFDAMEKGPEAARGELEEARDALQAFLEASAQQ